jgi:hypothetical protein
MQHSLQIYDAGRTFGQSGNAKNSQWSPTGHLFLAVGPTRIATAA